MRCPLEFPDVVVTWLRTSVEEALFCMEQHRHYCTPVTVPSSDHQGGLEHCSQEAKQSRLACAIPDHTIRGIDTPHNTSIIQFFDVVSERIVPSAPRVTESLAGSIGGLSVVSIRSCFIE